MAIDWKAQLMSTGSAGANLISILVFLGIGVAIILGLMLWIRYERSFKHVITVRVVTESKKRVFMDKFREFTDGDGVLWWQLRARKAIIPVAPPDAIDVMANGQIFVEAYYTPEGEYVFFSDKLKKDHVKSIGSIAWVADKPTKLSFNEEFKKYLENLAQWNKLPWYQKMPGNLAKLFYGIAIIPMVFFMLWPKTMIFLFALCAIGSFWISRYVTKSYVKAPAPPELRGRWSYIKDSNKAIESFQPLTTKQRLILVSQYKKANERKKHKFWENLPQIVAITGFVVFMIIMVVFWEDIVKPAKEAQQIGLERDKVLLEQSKILQQMMSEKQVIGQDSGTRGLIGDTPPK